MKWHEKVEEEDKNRNDIPHKFKPQKYLMACESWHRGLGHEKSHPDVYELCHVYNECEKTDSWIGAYVCGVGAFNVYFPKSSTRELTDKEIEKFAGRYGISGGYSFNLTEKELSNTTPGEPKQ